MSEKLESTQEIPKQERVLNTMRQDGVEPDPYRREIQEGHEVWLTKEDTLVVRDIERERARIEQYIQAQDLEYRQELESLNLALHPMSGKCRVAVNVPARFEEAHLLNLLEQYSQQVDENGTLLDPELFEINIIVNRKEGEVADNSLHVIRGWKAKHSQFRVNVVDIVLPQEKANVGVARKYITDLTLLRSLHRSTPAGPLYIESEDADLFSVNKYTINTIIKEFDEHPHLDVLAGIQDRHPEILQKNDLLFFNQRLWHFMEMVMRRQKYRPESFEHASFSWNRVMSCGWNTAYTAEVYAQVGGYESAVMGEDILIGEKISLLRGYTDMMGRIIPNTATAKSSRLRSQSSPRRLIDTMAKEVRSSDIYNDFEDQTLKSETMEGLLSKVEQYANANEDQRNVYEDTIKNILGFLRIEIPTPESMQVLQTTLAWIGLREGQHYNISTDGSVFSGLTLAGMQRIIELLKKYREDERYKRAYRNQNTPYEMQNPRRATINRSKR